MPARHADDICDGDLDATVVEADGTLTVEPFEQADDPPIDCFYVYPTISRDETAYSDWEASARRGGVRHPQPGRPAAVAVPPVRPGVPPGHAHRA